MTGVPPSGSGHSPKGGAASSTASPAKPSVPNAYVAVLTLVDEGSGGFSAILRVSYVSEDEALGRCLAHAKKDFPKWRVGNHMSVTIPFPASAMSAFGQDPEEGLEAKPASATGEAETPNA